MSSTDLQYIHKNIIKIVVQNEEEKKWNCVVWVLPKIQMIVRNLQNTVFTWSIDQKQRCF